MPEPNVNGCDMVYVERGAGQPLILVHGSVHDQRYWSPQLQAFAAAGFRAIALTLRHYGPARWDGTADDFSIDQDVEDVAAFITALGVGRADLVGHSRGGYIAYRVAERHPQLVDRLVLAEPAGVLGDDLLPAGAAPASYAALISDAVELVRQGQVEAGLRSFFDYALGPGSWDRLAPGRQQVCRDNARTLLGQIREGRTPYSRASAAAVRAPTLLVGGELTRPPFQAVLDGLTTAIGGARRATIPGAGHLMNWDDPAAFNAAVLDFLRR